MPQSFCQLYTHLIFSTKGRVRFLEDLSVLCVPNPKGEAFGVYLLEALGAGVPFVQPAVGATPEIAEATGGGILFDPAEEGGLRKALGSLLRNPDRARDLGSRGREAVFEGFNIDSMARKMIEIYEAYAGGKDRG